MINLQADYRGFIFKKISPHYSNGTTFGHINQNTKTIMKSLRSIAVATLLTIGAFTTITYTACNKDECKDVVCQNGGTCAGGNCSCPSGYEGDRCQTESRIKFLKQYTVTASCQATYVATITTNATGSNYVYINNFANLNAAAGTNTSVYATVDGNVITIPTQNVVGFSANITASGSGTYSNGTISFNYTVVSAGVTNTCNNTNWQ